MEIPTLLVFGERFFEATLTTIFIFVIVSLISVTIGLNLAALGKYYFSFLLPPMRIYTWFFRGIPELIVLFACYLALPKAGILLDPIPAAILAFVLIRVAYDYEVFRGCAEAVPEGQIEASRALGISRANMLRRIVLPQILRIATGPWITQSIGAVKAISLASAIAVAEVMQVTQTVIVATGRATEAIFIAAAIYACISGGLMVIETVLERRFDFLVTRTA